MTRYLLTVLLLAFSLSSFAQDRELVLELERVNPFRSMGFYCTDVVDLRKNKTLGIVKKGIKKKEFQAVFPIDFELYLQQTFDNFLPRKDDAVGTIFYIHTFEILQYQGTQDEIGICKIELEVARKIGDQIYSLGFAEAYLKKIGDFVFQTHKQRILKAIKYCLVQFEDFDWANTKGIPLEKANSLPDYQFDTIPKKGLYSSFGQIIRQRPILEKGFEIKEIESDTKYANYAIFEDSIQSERKIPFASDGKVFYINAGLYGGGNYLRSTKFVGPYIYFEDAQFEAINMSTTGVIAGGLVGFAIGSIIDHLADNSIIVRERIGYVFNVDTRNCYHIDKRRMEYLTKNYPDLWKAYKKSKKKPADVKQIIKQLNQRIREKSN